jgi:hypothetical protein
MAWVLLTVAGILEIAFAFGMKLSDGFTRLMPALFTVVTGVSSAFLLSLALRTLPVGNRLCGLDRYWRGGRRDCGNGGAGRLRRAAEAVLHCSHFGGRYRPQAGFGRLIVFGASLNPVTTRGDVGGEGNSGPEPGRPCESALAGEDIDSVHGRGAVAAATTEQCEVAV